MKKSGVIHTFMLYASTALLFRGVTMLLNPLYMRMFSPEQYGVLSLIESFVYIATTLIGVGLRKLLMLEYVHHSAEQQQKLINAIIVTHLLLATPFFCMMIVYKNMIITYLFKNNISTPIFGFVILITFCSFFCELLYQIMRFHQYAHALSLIHIFNALSIASLTLSGLYLFDLGLMAIPAAQAITMTFIIIISFMGWRKNNYKKYLSFRESVNDAPYYLYRSFPLTLNVFLLWFLESGDRWMLAQWSTMHQVGLYSAAYLCNSVMYGLVVMPWMGAYIPYILHQYANNKGNIIAVEDRNQKYMRMSMLALVLLVITGFFVFSWPLRVIIPPAYHQALPFIIPMMLSRILYFGAQWNLCLLQYYKKVALMNFMVVPPLIVAFVSNYFFVPQYGAWATSWIGLVSMVTYFILSWLSNRKVIRHTQHISNK